ncbi:MAG: 16S rRNA (guanine(966)-N(2))-methyltransferase RsmD [Oscillospiraceae bacterium]|nr:16S rRNA (guanine(966)-N(2))-methyltransferase RsmD [Oscillospiraceae bacterium]
MRVITGEARGRRLITLEGDDVRPTTDKVKEGMFNIIQFDIPGANVLDLFAGSGQLGIEAISRGAKHCCFVDASKRSLDVVKENLKNCGFEKRASTFSGDSLSYAELTKDTFDIVFLDPPYRKRIIDKVLPLIASKVSDGGIIVCETSNEEELPKTAGDFSLAREYKYGKIKITTYRKNK